MSDASVVFLPWVRQGLAARIATADPLTTPLPAQAPLGVSVGVNNVDAASVGVRLYGPADVLGEGPPTRVGAIREASAPSQCP